MVTIRSDVHDPTSRRTSSLMYTKFESARIPCDCKVLSPVWACNDVMQSTPVLHSQSNRRGAVGTYQQCSVQGFYPSSFDHLCGVCATITQ